MYLAKSFSEVENTAHCMCLRADSSLIVMILIVLLAIVA